MEENKITCPSCGTENTNTSKFCSNCGTKIMNEKKFCTNCGTENKNTSKYCLNCGSELVKDLPKVEASESVESVPSEPVQVVEEPPVQNNQPVNYPYMVYNRPKKKKKGLLIAGIIVLVLLIAAIPIFIFGSSKKAKESDGKRTILIYMVGADLESQYKAASMDLDEIKNSGINIDETRIVVYTGGSKKWSGGFENNTVYELTKEGYKDVKKFKAQNMGSSSTLTSFIDYAIDKYTSDKYDLIFWNHGGGPIYGFGVDETSNKDMLSLLEISSGIKNSEFISEKNKFEFIGFDACLMGSIEIGSIMANYANYMIASEEVEPSFGWDYGFLKEIKSSTDAETLAKHVIDYTYDFYQNISKKYLQTFYVTLSALDLSKIKTVEDNVSSLFKSADENLDNNTYSELVKYATKSTSFGYNGADQSYDLIDLKEMSESLEAKYGSLARDLTKSIDEMVVYQKTNIAGANGVSIYYPYYTKKYLDNFMSVYETLPFSSDYKSFLKRYVNILTGEKIIEYVKTIIIENNDNTLSASLDEQVANNSTGASLVVFKKLDNGKYMLMFESDDVELDESNKLITDYDRKYISLVVNGEVLGPVGGMDYSKKYKDTNKQIYAVAVELHRGTVADGTWEIEPAIIQFIVDDEHPNGQMINIIPVIDLEDITNSRTSINLEEWENIKFYTYSDYVFDDEGNFIFGETTEEHGFSAEQHSQTISTTTSFDLKISYLDNDAEYYGLFLIEDTQGNNHASELVKIE